MFGKKINGGKTSMKKRILALVLSVAMVLSFMPFSAFATDTATTNTNEVAILNVPEESSAIRPSAPQHHSTAL